MADRQKIRSRFAGFTLIELLVCIAVVAALVAIVMPSLGAGRTRARVTRSLTLASGCTYALAQYAVDYQDSHLFFQTPGQPWLDVEVEGVRRQRLAYFVAGMQNWINFLPVGYLAADPQTFDYNPATMIERNADNDLPQQFIWSRFWLTPTMFATREYWRAPIFGEAPEGFCRGTRGTDIATPSAKGIVADFGFWRLAPGARNPLVPIAFADGSGAEFSVSQWQSLPSAAAPAGYGLYFEGIFATPDGLSGRDR